MVIITGIKTAIKIAPIIYKIGKIGYKGFKSTRKGQQWLSRHPKAVKTATAAVGVGGLLLDLTNIDYSAIQIPRFPSKNRQTRTNVYGTKYGRINYPKYKYLYGRRYRRENVFNRRSSRIAR